MLGRRTTVISVASGRGAGNPGCQDGPDVLRCLAFLHDLEGPEHGLHWGETLRVLAAAETPPLQAILDLSRRLAATVQKHMDSGDFPLVIGGDHSCAIGTWSGVVASLRRRAGAEARLGLIWIDAHMDSHTPRTSPSQNIHGMPLACLLGYGDPGLVAVGGMSPKLQPQDVCLVGVPSFEAGEAELLQTLGVRVYHMDEVRQRGVRVVLEEARCHVSNATAGYGLSLDIDVLDPTEEPGVGTPVAHGLWRAEVIQALVGIRDNPHLLALEIVEYNPYADTKFVTAKAVHDLCQSLI